MKGTKIMQTTIFRNENKVSTEEVLNLFTQTLETADLFKKSEIEELSDIVAKNPADKFIVSEKPNGFFGNEVIDVLQKSKINREQGLVCGRSEAC